MARPRIVIIGAVSAGHTAARELIKLSRGQAEIVVINPTDYFLYLPLLPEVAAGILEPRRICVSLPKQLPRVQLILGTVTRVDLGSRRVDWTDSEDQDGSIEY